MSSNSNRFVPYIDVYFKVYGFAGLTFQFTLLILIIKRSPAILSNLKYFLLNTCSLQICSISLAFFTQHRNIPNATSLAVLARGPCRSFGPEICFSAYHFFLGVALCVGLGISNTIIFRYQTLRRGRVTRKRIVIMIALTYIPSLLTIILPFTSIWNFAEVRAMTYFEHPNYDFSIYEPFVGFFDITSFQFIFATVLLAIGAYAIPAISGFLTRRVIHLINDNRGMSSKTKEQSKTLAYGLACQTFLPLVCYIPLPTTYIICQIFNLEMLLAEHLLPVLICLPSFLDPFISFYFIIPYRQALSNIIRCCWPFKCHRRPRSTTFIDVRVRTHIPSMIIESN